SALRADTRVTSKRASSSFTWAVSAMGTPSPSDRQSSPRVLRQESAVEQQITVAGRELEAVMLARAAGRERVCADLRTEELRGDPDEGGLLRRRGGVDENDVEAEVRRVPVQRLEVVDEGEVDRLPRRRPQIERERLEGLRADDRVRQLGHEQVRHDR